MRRSMRLTIAALLLIAFAPAALTYAASPATIRFATFNASLNRGAPVRRWPTCPHPATPRPTPSPRSSSGSGRTSCSSTSSTSTRHEAARKAFQQQLPERAHNGAAADPLPVHVRGAVEHRHLIRLRPEQQRRHRHDARRQRIRRRQLRLRRVPRPVRDGGVLEATRSIAARSAPSSTSSGRTCRARCCRTIPATPAPADWYSPAELAIFRSVVQEPLGCPIRIEGETVHFLVSHPTPPVFDGPEDRNGTRNHDEIRFWADYITPARRPSTSTTTRASTAGSQRASCS